jgi:hypothetical protein
MDVSLLWVSCVRGLCDELITRPEESYRPWCVVVCNLETSRMRRLWPALGYCIQWMWRRGQLLLCICRSATRWWRENMPVPVLNTVERKAVVSWSSVARNIWLVWYMYLYWWCCISFTSFVLFDR